MKDKLKQFNRSLNQNMGKKILVKYLTLQKEIMCVLYTIYTQNSVIIPEY